MLLWLEQGGPIMKILVGLNIIGFTIMLWKVISLVSLGRRLPREKEHFMAYFQQYQQGAINIEGAQRLEIALSHYMDPYYWGLDTIKVIAAISPLLGLLGTVIGILQSFSVIAKHGMDNPALFADGISLALITTVGGLIVAIPHFVGHNYLRSSLIGAERRLEKLLICEAISPQEKLR